MPHATAGTGIRAYVTGPNAANVAFANLIGQRLPWLVAWSSRCPCCCW